MKNLSIVLILFLFNCKPKPVELSSQNLEGTWKHHNSRSSNGADFFDSGPIIGYEFEFKSNGKFVQKEINKIFEGSFKIENDILKLNYFPNDSLEFFDIILSKNEFTLNPILENGSFVCDEGCSETYKREK